MTAEIIDLVNYQRPPLADQQAIRDTVSLIIAKVAAEGDAAVSALSQSIDNFPPELITLKPFNDYELTESLRSAIHSSYNRIKNFCRFQAQQLKNNSFSDDCGEFSSIYQPIERIGAYIPGGRFPLISTALMTLTPAQVAGCSVRIACSPSDDPALLAAASLAGATHFIRVGGAQAIAAMSYGWNGIEPVNMIVGPGNSYVNEAKAQIQQRTQIDTLAGPSELLIYANKVNHPDWLVADALAQAEHDPAAISLIVSESAELLATLKGMLLSQAEAAALFESGNIVLLHSQSADDSLVFINDYAPEHLHVCVTGMRPDDFKNYGALFIGENSAVAFGDYCSGPNHTLPTAGAAHFSGGLSVHRFLKVLTRQQITDQGREVLATIATKLAAAEGLTAHQHSAELRKLN